jgi:hypothetical protein
MTKPLVFLIDMDGTFIGDTTLQLCRYDICKTLKIKNPFIDILFQIKNGLVRPHFESFIKTMKIKYPEAEFYVYTAAEGIWAATLIKYVETALDIKFNRPIFSRKSCIHEGSQMRKSISKVLPQIYKKLKVKYPAIESINDLHKNILLIDNNYVITSIDMYKFLKCPTYSSVVPIDPISGIPMEKIEKILPILIRYGLLPKVVEETDLKKVLAIYYTNIGQVFRQTKIDETDRFWYYLEKIFRSHRIHSLNKKVVVYLQKSLQE